MVSSARRESRSFPPLATSRTRSCQAPRFRRDRKIVTLVAPGEVLCRPACRTRRAPGGRAERAFILIFGIQASDQVGHLEHRYSRIPPLVAVGAASPGFGLFVGVAGEDAESNRRLGLGAGRGETSGRLGGYIVEVRSLAADNRADSDDPVVALIFEEPAGGDRKLPRPRDPDHIDVLENYSVFEQRLERSVDELFYNRFVEAAGQNSDASPSAARQSRELSHLRREEVSELRPFGFEVA